MDIEEDKMRLSVATARSAQHRSGFDDPKPACLQNPASSIAPRGIIVTFRIVYREKISHMG